MKSYEIDKYKEIDFNDKDKISLKLNSPLFSDELTHSFPINIPSSLENDPTLDFKNNIDVINDSADKECVIEHDFLSFKGKFKDVSTKSFYVY